MSTATSSGAPAPGPSTGPAASSSAPTTSGPAAGSSAPAGVAPSTSGTQRRGFMDKVGDFFSGILNNFTGNNTTGTGLGAIIGTVAGSGIGYLVGGLPGLLVGAGAGIAGGGLLNELAVQVMEWAGLKVPTASRFAGGRTVVAQPDDELATRQELNVSVPGVSSPVRTTTLVPKDENYRQLEQLSLSMEEYQRKHGAGSANLGTAINNRLTEIQRMPVSRRSSEMGNLIADQDHVFQFMENTRRWNELSTQWAATGGDRDKLVEANNRAAEGLTLPKLEVPGALVFAPANRYATIPDEFVREVTEAGPARDAFLQKPPVTQLKEAYNAVDRKINEIDIAGKAAAAKASQGGAFGGRSWSRIGMAANKYNPLVQLLEGSDAAVENKLNTGQLPIENAADAVHMIARITEAPDHTYTDSSKRLYLMDAVKRGRGHSMNQQQRELFDAVEERIRLEEMRERMNNHFGQLANDAQRGYDQLIRNNGFSNYTQQVEELRTAVGLRNQRVDELNQSQIRIVARGQSTTPPDDNNRYITVRDERNNSEVTMVAQKNAAGAWEITHSFQGGFDATKVTPANSLATRMPVSDIFTDSGITNTVNLGETIRQPLGIMQARLGISRGAAASTPAISATPEVTPPAVTPAGSAPAPVPGRPIVR